MTDLIGGQVMMFSADFRRDRAAAQGRQDPRPGRHQSSKRSAAVPELPTVNEALGLKDYELIAYFRRVRAGRHAAGHREQAQRRHQRRGQRQGPAGQVCGQRLCHRPGHARATWPSATKAETAKWEKAIRDAKIEPQ
jgi:hypothetical protein